MDLGGLVGDMTMGSLIGGLIFSGVGFVAFMYGKKQGLFRPMVIGGLLMAYPFFVTNAWLVFLIGAGLTGALFFARD